MTFRYSQEISDLMFEAIDQYYQIPDYMKKMLPVGVKGRLDNAWNEAVKEIAAHQIAQEEEDNRRIVAQEGSL